MKEIYADRLQRAKDKLNEQRDRLGDAPIHGCGYETNKASWTESIPRSEWRLKAREVIERGKVWKEEQGWRDDCASVASLPLTVQEREDRIDSLVQRNALLNERERKLKIESGLLDAAEAKEKSRTTSNSTDGVSKAHSENIAFDRLISMRRDTQSGMKHQDEQNASDGVPSMTIAPSGRLPKRSLSFEHPRFHGKNGRCHSLHAADYAERLSEGIQKGGGVDVSSSRSTAGLQKQEKALMIKDIFRRAYEENTDNKHGSRRRHSHQLKQMESHLAKLEYTTSLETLGEAKLGDDPSEHIHDTNIVNSTAIVQYTGRTEMNPTTKLLEDSPSEVLAPSVQEIGDGSGLKEGTTKKMTHHVSPDDSARKDALSVEGSITDSDVLLDENRELKYLLREERRRRYQLEKQHAMLEIEVQELSELRQRKDTHKEQMLKMDIILQKSNRHLGLMVNENKQLEESILRLQKELKRKDDEFQEAVQAEHKRREVVQSQLATACFHLNISEQEKRENIEELESENYDLRKMVQRLEMVLNRKNRESRYGIKVLSESNQPQSTNSVHGGGPILSKPTWSTAASDMTSPTVDWEVDELLNSSQMGEI